MAASNLYIVVNLDNVTVVTCKKCIDLYIFTFPK